MAGTTAVHPPPVRGYLKGIYVNKEMASFADLLEPEDGDAIHGYLIARANEDWGRSASDGTGPH